MDANSSPFDPVTIPVLLALPVAFAEEVGGSPSEADVALPARGLSQAGPPDAREDRSGAEREPPSFSAPVIPVVPAIPALPLSTVSPENPHDLSAFFAELFSSQVPDHVRRKTREEVYATLDEYGPGYFLEEVARGSIPIEIAFRYELPTIYFMRWLQDRADVEDYNYAMTLCADSLAAKSRAVLELSPDNNAEGMMIREYAKRALDLAERIAPDGWSGSKKPKSDGPTHQALQIAIMLPGDGRTIPGIELLGQTP